MDREKKRVAIVKLSAMGDIIHAMVALQFIKNKYMQIDWVVEECFAALLEDNPDINEIIMVNLKRIKKEKFTIFSELNSIKKHKQKSYDLVIDAQGLLKSAITSRLIGNSVVGFSKESIREKLASYLYTQKVEIDYAENTIDRNAKVIGSAFGYNITSEMILNKTPFLFYRHDRVVDLYLKGSQKNIVFIIGSTWESRNYPKENFAKLAKLMKENILIVWGNSEEKSRAEWISSQVQYATVLPKLDLNGLKALIGNADLTIGNDTGPTHMAWAMNRPSITIFGPTPVSRIYTTDINRAVKSNSKVNPYRLNKNDFSIRNIDAQQIFEVAEELLAKQRSKNGA